MLKVKRFKWWLWALIFSASSTAKDIVRYNISEKHPDNKQSYYVALLDLAMKKSQAKYGDYILEPVVIEMAQGRTSIMVQLNQGIDITWRVSSQELEKRLKAVYIPLLKGLMGHRIFIIKRENQEKYNQSMSYEDLQRYTAGQGYDWPDSIILQHNGINVMEGGSVNLLNMLSKERFDFYPRALFEPWQEIEQWPNLSVEQHVLLRYPSPFYFFVNIENERLHQRLTFGLEQAIEDGSFDQLFYSHPITSQAMALAKIHQRKVFIFHNPILSVESQILLKDPKYWIKLTQR